MNQELLVKILREVANVIEGHNKKVENKNDYAEQDLLQDEKNKEILEVVKMAKYVLEMKFLTPSQHKFVSGCIGFYESNDHLTKGQFENLKRTISGYLPSA